MKRALKSLLIFLIIISSMDVYPSGDAHFSQFYSNYLYLNPAFAGSAICPRIILNYRNQMPYITGELVGFTNKSASFDGFYEKASGGLGVMILQESEAKIFKTTNISGIYSYRMSINRKFTLNIGFQFSYIMKSLDGADLVFPDQISGSSGFVRSQSISHPTAISNSTSAQDFSVGLLGFSTSYFCGLSVHHLTAPNMSLGGTGGGSSKLSRKFTLHGGAIFDLKSEMKRGNRSKRRDTDPTISPNLIFTSQGRVNYLSYGAYINQYPIIFGTWMRQSFSQFSSAILVVGLHKGVFKFGYSLDIPLMKVGFSGGCANEISCTYKLPCRPQKKKIRAIDCPTF